MSSPLYDALVNVVARAREPGQQLLAQACADADRVLSETHGTICRCGLAESYHDGRLAQRDEYVPRYGQCNCPCYGCQAASHEANPA